MANDQAFDLGEMPLATVIQALSIGRPLVVLPVVMLRRTPHLYLLAKTGQASHGPAGLRGKAIGVRSYAQTTGVWVRAVLESEFGLAVGEIRWVTSSPEPFPTLSLPSFVERSDESDFLSLLQSGAVSAAISTAANTGPDTLNPVIENPLERGEQWLARTSILPINHVLVSTVAGMEAKGDVIAAFVDRVRSFALGDASSAGWAGGDALMRTRSNVDCFDGAVISASAQFFVKQCSTQGLIGQPVDVSNWRLSE